MLKNLKKDNFQTIFKAKNEEAKKSRNALIREAFGMTSPYALEETENLISEKQIEILEDAIRRYQRLEDIRKFTNLALSDIEAVTEEEILRALEAEREVSIEDEKAVLDLIQNEGFLKDLNAQDFSKVLAEIPESAGLLAELNGDNPDMFDKPLDEDYFDDFDF